MSGFTLTQTAGFADSLFGKSAAPISMVLEQGLEAFEIASTYNKIFSVRTSKNFAEKLTALSAMDGFEPVGENGAYPTSDMTEVFSKTLEHEVWKKKFSISREMVDDAKFDLMRIEANKFIQAYGRTREQFAGALLGGATGNSLKFGKRTFSTKCSDDKPMFATNHPNYYKASKTQSNLFAGEFSEDTLTELETRMQNTLGDKDEILGIIPDTIIIPNIGSLKKQVFAVIGADKDPATNNNGFNFQFGRWNVIINPYWTVTGTDKPFILMDSRFNDLEGSAVWYDRVKLETEAYVDKETDAGVYKGYARWSAGFNNWRGMFMGGVTGGTSLT